jgi:hypothetical protein
MSKSALFTEAHKMAAKIIRRDLGDSYAATFAACLRLAIKLASLKDRISRISAEHAVKSAEFARINRGQNEGGGGYQHGEMELCRLMKGMDAAIREKLDIEFSLEWDRSTTAARRIEWNAALKAAQNGKATVSPAIVGQLATRFGYEMSDLKKAVAMHGM